MSCDTNGTNHVDRNNKDNGFKNYWGTNDANIHYYSNKNSIIKKEENIYKEIVADLIFNEFITIDVIERILQCKYRASKRKESICKKIIEELTYII